MESPPGEQFVKLIGTPRRRQLLGAHIIGPQASLLLQPLVQAMSLGNDRAEWHEVSTGSTRPWPRSSRTPC